jgi:hypothetical protein
MAAMPDDAEVKLETLFPTGSVSASNLYEVTLQAAVPEKNVKETIRLRGDRPVRVKD